MNNIKTAEFTSISKSFDNKYVWYATYGLDTIEDQFLCLIKGGKQFGKKKEYKGCKDKSHPIALEEIYIHRQLYFADFSKFGDSILPGIGFISEHSDSTAITYGRMYLITKLQFIEVINQKIPYLSQENIPFENAISVGSLLLNKEAWYGNMIYIGNKNSFPIFTFTNSQKNYRLKMPDKNNLRYFSKELKRAFNLTNAEIVDYFITKPGITENLNKSELEKLFEEENSNEQINGNKLLF